MAGTTIGFEVDENFSFFFHVVRCVSSFSAFV